MSAPDLYPWVDPDQVIDTIAGLLWGGIAMKAFGWGGIVAAAVFMLAVYFFQPIVRHVRNQQG